METPSPNGSTATDLPYGIFLSCFVFFSFLFLTAFFGYCCKWLFWDAVFSYYQDLQGLDIYLDEDIHHNNSSIKKTWKSPCFRAPLFPEPTHGPDPQWVCFMWALLRPQMWGVPRYSKPVPSPSGSSSRAHQPSWVGSAPNILHPSVTVWESPAARSLALKHRPSHPC